MAQRPAKKSTKAGAHAARPADDDAGQTAGDDAGIDWFVHLLTAKADPTDPMGRNTLFFSNRIARAAERGDLLTACKNSWLLGFMTMGSLRAAGVDADQWLERLRASVKKSNHDRALVSDEEIHSRYLALPEVYRISNSLAAERIHTLLRPDAEKSKAGKRHAAKKLPSAERIRKRLAALGVKPGSP